MDPSYGIDLSGLWNIFLDIPGWWHTVEGLALIRTVKFLLFIYIVVLFIDVALLLSFRGVTRDLRVNLLGTDQRPLFSGRARQTGRRWEKIFARLSSGDASQYQLAVLEADALADTVMAASRWAGTNLGERMASVPSGQIESIESLRLAHAVRNQIVNDATFAIDHEGAERVLGLYAQFLEEMELL
ncbi:MAG: hypothetical protein WAU28_03330 [Candidatus Moraniibacteriota bacterium]